MQHPVGYQMVHGKPQLNDIWALFTNPVFVWGYTKVVLAALATGAAVMLAVSAWQLRAGGDRAVFGRSARLSLVVLVPAILLAMLVGDELGVIEARYQPMKIAAAEAQWTTCQPCSFSLFQIGGGNNDHTPTQILEIPHLLSLLATNHWNGKVIGHDPAANPVRGQVRTWQLRAERLHPVLGHAGDGLPGRHRGARRAVGTVAEPAQEARDVQACSCGSRPGWCAAVPDQHGRLAAHRESAGSRGSCRASC